jgi:hypothetical protein
MNWDEWQPRSRYFRERREMAIRWVERQNGTGKEMAGDKAEQQTAGYRTVVRGPRKRSLRLATGKILGYNDRSDLPLVQPTPGLYADGI